MDLGDDPTDDRRLRRIQRLTARSMTQSTLLSISSSAGTLVLQLFTGILTARLLGSAGRGEIEAVMSWVNLAAVVFAFGVPSGLAYLQAAADRPSGSILTGGLLTVGACSAVAILVTQVLIPVGYAQQSAAVIDLARVAMFGIVLVMGTNLVRTLLAANNFFPSVATNTIGQPLVYALGALTLWAVGSYSVSAIVAVQILSFGAMFALGLAVLRSVAKPMRPRRSEIVDATKFGLRGWGGTLSRVANARLDVVLLPAFVAASEIGVYVVAVSVGSMVVASFQQLNRVAFTNVARTSGLDRTHTVERLLRLVLFGSGAAATALFVVGPTLITVIYGDDFATSGTPLRLLLPGLVLWACNGMMVGVLAGLGRPGRASLAQLAGAIMTVVGLAVMLPWLGILGAAITSTLAYTVVAIVNVVFLRRSLEVSLARIGSPRHALHDGLTTIKRFVR